ncbi:hypothetical protein [Levilactobacillus spicheri]|uniref:Uncharacterized protein n=1 Tax=Levilactobacillus spicheri TaxID=216463 RepID=A0A0F3RNX4_9LACO|nr:hypothetical protein [Levilactobacillus spicheri]KJW11713.1 hypothetical protein VC81_13075 [Levilactobacillus spicheri]
MLASTEAIIIEVVFSLGALIAVAGLGGLIWTKQHHRGFRPAMTVILCGVGIVIIASLLNVLLFKTYAGVRVKKNQYYEITSLTTNMRASLASSQAPQQPVTPAAKKASRNVTYLVTHTDQSQTARRAAKAAQRQLTQHKQPDVAVVKHNYRIILDHYFDAVTSSTKAQQHLSDHAYQHVTQRPARH